MKYVIQIVTFLIAYFMKEGYRPKPELSSQESKRQTEAREIVEKINDPRLRADEHLEYFTIHLKDGIRHTPKRRILESSETNRYIENHLRKILDEEK